MAQNVPPLHLTRIPRRPADDCATTAAQQNDTLHGRRNVYVSARVCRRWDLRLQ
jgi:hypothetical protein